MGVGGRLRETEFERMYSRMRQPGWAAVTESTRDFTRKFLRAGLYAGTLEMGGAACWPPEDPLIQGVKPALATLEAGVEGQEKAALAALTRAAKRWDLVEDDRAAMEAVDRRIAAEEAAAEKIDEREVVEVSDNEN